MKTNRIRFFVVLAVATGFLCSEVLAVQRGRGNQQQQRMQQQKIQDGQSLRDGAGRAGGDRGVQRQTDRATLSTQESAMLRFMREEEKLARDVYLTLNEKWGGQIFANIARAESQHMAAVANLLSRYNIPDPVETDKRGVFTLPQFQELYNSLIESGSKSALDAVSVGLKIEEMDIVDLRSAIASTDRADVQRVLRNLERASENHLRAFARQLLQMGGSYTATSLNQEEFNSIATAPGGTRGNRGNANRGSANRDADNSSSNRARNGRRGGKGRQR